MTATATTDSAPSLDLQTINDKRVLKQLIAAIAEQPPRQADPPVLKLTVSARTWKRLVAEVADPHSIVGDVTVFYRTWIRKLAETHDARAVEQILPHVDSPRTQVRDAAIVALGQFRDPAAVPVLAKLLLERDVAVREATVKALGAIRDARAVPALVQLGVQDPLIRMQAHKALQTIGETAVEQLVPLLRSSDSAVVLEATLALGQFANAAIVEGLIGILDHPAVVIRAQAVETLGRIGDRKSVPALIARLSDAEAAVRAQAALALARLPDAKALPALHRVASDPDDDVVAAAAKALAEIADPRSGELFRKLLEHPVEDVRAQAARGLGEIGDKTTTAALMAAARDKSPEVRLHGIAGLRNFRGQAEVVTQLLESVQESAAPLRLRAVQVLGELRAASAASTLARLLSADPFAEVRGAAARALGMLKSPQHLPELEEALHDEFFVRCQAIAAMAEIGNTTSLPVLLALLHDPMPEIQYHAAIALGDLGHQNAMRPLELLLKSENDIVRRGAAKALVKLGHPRGEKLLAAAAKKRRKPLNQQLINALPAPLVLLFLADSLAVRIATWSVFAAILLSPVALVWRPSFGTASTATPVIAQRGKVSSLAWTAEGKSLVVGRSRGQIEIWDPDSKTLTESIVTETNGAIARVFGGGSAAKFLFERDGGLTIRKQDRWEPIPGHQKAIKAAQVSPNGRFAVTLGEDHLLCLWNLHDETLVKSINAPMLDARTLAVSNDGSAIVLANGTGRVLAIEVASNKVPWDITLARVPIPVAALAYHPNGTRLAILDAEGMVRIVDPEGRFTSQLPHPGNGIPKSGARAWFDPGGAAVLYVIHSGTVVRWDLLKKKSTKLAGVQANELLSVSPDGRRLATASSESAEVTVIDLESETTETLDKAE